MNITTKICPHCGNDFETKNSRKKYCSNTCKTYASEVRTGKRKQEGREAPEKEKPVLLNQDEIREKFVQLHKDIEEANEEYERLLNQRINLKVLKSLNIRISHLENVLSKDDLSKEDRASKNKLLDQMKIEKEESEDYNENLHIHRANHYKKIDKAFLTRFRAIEARNDFVKNSMENPKELKGDSIAAYQSAQTRYPFDQIDHVLFANMGNPIQPFISSITGAKESGKSILSVMIACELVHFFEAKVLYILDSQNKDRSLEYFTKYKLQSDNVVIVFADSLQDIEKALSRDDYEFVFIDSSSSFNLNYTTVKTFQKQYPKLSIFCIFISESSSIVGASHIHFKTQIDEDTGYGMIKGAYALIYNNGVHQDESCGIFCHNEYEGFKMIL